MHQKEMKEAIASMPRRRSRIRIATELCNNRPNQNCRKNMVQRGHLRGPKVRIYQNISLIISSNKENTLPKSSGMKIKTTTRK